MQAVVFFVAMISVLAGPVSAANPGNCTKLVDPLSLSTRVSGELSDLPTSIKLDRLSNLEALAAPFFQANCNISCLPQTLIDELRDFVAYHPIFSPAQLAFRNDDGAARDGGFWPFWPSLSPHQNGAVNLAADTALLLPPTVTLRWLASQLSSESGYAQLRPRIYSLLADDPRLRRELALLFFDPAGAPQVLQFARDPSAPGNYLADRLKPPIIASLADYLKRLQSLLPKEDVAELVVSIQRPSLDSPLEGMPRLEQLANPDLLQMAMLSRNEYIAQSSQRESEKLEQLAREKEAVPAEVAREVMRWSFSDGQLITEQSIRAATKNINPPDGVTGTCYLRGHFIYVELFRIGEGRFAQAMSYALAPFETAWRPALRWSYHVAPIFLLADPNETPKWMAIDDFQYDQNKMLPLAEGDFQLFSYEEDWKVDLFELHRRALDPTGQLRHLSREQFQDKASLLNFKVDDTHIFDARASLFISEADRRHPANRPWLKFNLAKIYVGNPGQFPQPLPSESGFPVSMRQAHLGAFMSWLVRVKDAELSDQLKGEFFFEFDQLLLYVEELLETDHPVILHLLQFTPDKFREDLKASLRRHLQ